MKTIYSSYLKDILPSLAFGQYIYSQYNPIREILSKSIGKQGEILLSKPHISEAALNTNDKASWHLPSALDKRDFVAFTKLDDNKKKEAIEKLQTVISEVRNLTNKIRTSDKEEYSKWATVIERAIQVPSEDCIFYDGEFITLAAWSCYSSDQNKQSSFKIAHFLEGHGFKLPPLPTGVNEEEEEKEEIAPAAVPVPTPIKEEVVVNEIKKEKKPKEKKEKTKKSLWWLWLIIVLLAIAIGVYFLFFAKGCNIGSPLPKQEKVIQPYDPDEIGIPEGDSARGATILNRLLITFTENSDITVIEFAKEYKKMYPKKDYQITYSDTSGIFKSLEVGFPSAELEEIKEKLEDKYKDMGISIIYVDDFSGETVPGDPGFSDLDYCWGFDAIYAYEAWDITEGDENIIVAVIDDGFDLSHEEFKGKIYKPYNAVFNNDDVKIYNSMYGVVGEHGTHVASTVMGNHDNSGGVCGIAPNVKLMPIQVGDPNGVLSTTAIINGIEYAIENGANVINMSLGAVPSSFYLNLPIEYQEELNRMVNEQEIKMWTNYFSVAESHNVTIVIAAGNSDAVIGFDAMSRTGKTINVSAVNPDENKAVFSNFGDLSTISAPGVDIYNAAPGNKYQQMSGTSMASPIVAGGVAILKSKNPNLTNGEIKDILIKTATPISQSDETIGNLLNLYDALLYVDDYEGCPDIQDRIDSLQAEIDRLERICNDSSYMEIPEDPIDCKFAEGKWKSTTDLFNTSNQEPVELFFDFTSECTGTITFVEASGGKSTAPLLSGIDNKSFYFEMTEESKDAQGNNVYIVHSFTATPDQNKEAICIASVNGQVTVEFKLLKY